MFKFTNLLCQVFICFVFWNAKRCLVIFCWKIELILIWSYLDWDIGIGNRVIEFCPDDLLRLIWHWLHSIIDIFQFENTARRYYFIVNYFFFNSNYVFVVSMLSKKTFKRIFFKLSEKLKKCWRRLATHKNSWFSFGAPYKFASTLELFNDLSELIVLSLGMFGYIFVENQKWKLL